MGGYYTVKQGDYLSRIAKQFGFSDYLNRLDWLRLTRSPGPT